MLRSEWARSEIGELSGLEGHLILQICWRNLHWVIGPELALEFGDMVKISLEVTDFAGEVTWRIVCGTGCNRKYNTRN